MSVPSRIILEKAHLQIVAEPFLVEEPGEPIFELLPETDLGSIYRGDTVLLPVWQAVSPYDGSVINLTGGTVWFTAKLDLARADAAPETIQLSTALGGVAILDPISGTFQVTIPSTATQALSDDAAFVFDCQVRAGSPARTTTVRRGIFTVVRDVTRATA